MARPPRSKTQRRRSFVHGQLLIIAVLSFHLACSYAFQSHLSSILQPQAARRKEWRKRTHLEALPVSDSLLEEAENLLLKNKLTNSIENDTWKQKGAASSRRMLMASALFAAGAAIAPDEAKAKAVENTSLQWEASPVNKRSGVTVFAAEKNGYNVRFVTYLSRFLLCFDADCQRWWYSRASDLPRTATAQQVDEMRLQQFGAFSASVEVGLQEYTGPDGPRNLMASLLERYCPDSKKLAAEREAKGLPPQSDSETARQQREIKEARRQIAILFSLMETYQPVEEISKVLAAIDNGSIAKVEISDPGSGYAPGYGPPVVTFAPPGAGEDYETAMGRAMLRPNGKVLRIDIKNRGSGYTKPPNVIISPPEALRPRIKGKLEGTNVTACAATAKAFIYKSGPKKGMVERIQLVDPGNGYREGERIRVILTPPQTKPNEGGVTAVAEAVKEYEVGGIEIVKGGSGYAVEKPISVYVEPPPITARVNMNDPDMARIISPDEPLPLTQLNKRPPPTDKEAFLIEDMIQSLATNEGKGGGGGCIGRACYDRGVVATAYARAEVDSYNAFRSSDDALKAQKVEVALAKRGAEAAKKVVSATSSGRDAQTLPSLPFWGGGPSSSASLLSLLPAGIGVEYSPKFKRYMLSRSPDFDSSSMSPGSSSRPLDPEFGPRGRSPIEREMELGIATYLRFATSGAICCSAVHLALTPIDVVKTKVQTDPKLYPGVISSLKKISKEEGMGTFFTGWAPTFVGFFFWGGVGYTVTEFLRRYLTDLAGAEAVSLEVPIILAASAVGAMLGSVIIAPFEAVRIRSVAQPNYAPSIDGVLKRMVEEEGVWSLFSAVPVFLLKEIPFAMAKFTVFDLSTAWMYEAFPAAREDLRLSLFVSLLGGTLGGVTAAIVSNPADATISEMKKAKTEMTPVEAAGILWNREGIPDFFRGLPLRMFFYSLIVSLQFLVYDAIRFALGIGTDDLKLYLDVLGGALKESGGPV